MADEVAALLTHDASSWDVGPSTARAAAGLMAAVTATIVADIVATAAVIATAAATKATATAMIAAETGMAAAIVAIATATTATSPKAKPAGTVNRARRNSSARTTRTFFRAGRRPPGSSKNG